MRICKPVVKASLDQMNGLQRTSECFHYTLLSLEFWISPDGKAREWIKANVKFAMFIAAPTLMVFPVVTLALWELEAWINALTTITSKLIVLPILALLAFISFFVFYKIIGGFRR